MNKIRIILLDALILFAVSTVFVALADQAFSGLKANIPKDDPVVTAIGKGELSNLESVIATLESNSKASVATQTDEHGRSSLMRAAYANLSDSDKLKEADKKRVPMIATLLAHGAPVDGQDSDGWTALMWAAWSGMPGVVNALLEKSASHALADRQGNTALIIAAQRGHADIVTALLANGASQTAKNKAGRTARDAAQTGLDQHPASQYPKRSVGYHATLAELK